MNVYTLAQACEIFGMYQSLKEYIRLKAGLEQSSQEVKEVEARLTARLDFLSSFINLTWPARLELDATVLGESLKRISSEYGAEGFATAIHKNDLMFAFHLNRFPHDPAEALTTYYRVGLSTAQNLAEIAESYGIQTNRLLDFGSGYGRVSRFLKPLFPDAECVISEVKEQAVKFQEEELNLPGIHHSSEPGDFPSEKFDLILALSVFTHLPEALFRGWMTSLSERLSDNGAMVFTFLDQGREESQEILKNFNARPSGLEYIRRSEDSYFSFVGDRLRNDEEYGSTFITRQWLSQLCDELDLRIDYLDYALVKSQDAAIIMRK